MLPLAVTRLLGRTVLLMRAVGVALVRGVGRGPVVCARGVALPRGNVVGVLVVSAGGYALSLRCVLVRGVVGGLVQRSVGVVEGAVWVEAGAVGEVDGAVREVHSGFARR